VTERRRGGRGEGIVGKIWWAFVSKYAAISPRKISPNSRSFSRRHADAGEVASLAG